MQRAVPSTHVLGSIPEDEITRITGRESRCRHKASEASRSGFGGKLERITGREDEGKVAAAPGTNCFGSVSISAGLTSPSPPSVWRRGDGTAIATSQSRWREDESKPGGTGEKKKCQGCGMKPASEHQRRREVNKWRSATICRRHVLPESAGCCSFTRCLFFFFFPFVFNCFVL